MNTAWFKNFIPATLECYKDGTLRKYLFSDIFAGISIGIISLPLALAFAIGSGVLPERGLFTAIIAGFLISLLGGSRVQIAGPTGTFIVIIYGIVERHGYEGLVISTLMASVFLVIMGLARFGVLLKFIPYPVTTGFTSGIAVVIVATQLKEFLGLEIEKVPPEFLKKCSLYCQFIHTWNPWAFLVASGVLIAMFTLRRFYPKAPNAIITIIVATVLVHVFDLPISTIESKFNELPSTLPWPSFPSITWEKIQTLFPEAISITLLAGIESLLSAVIADGLTGHKHRSNCELVAQGIGNFGSAIFGGIPATGAIARTSANVRLGAKTPVSGMIHAVTVLLLILFFAPQAGKIPLCSLSAVLIYVAWYMSEAPHFVEILHGPKSESIVLLVTFTLTILIDLTVALQVGVLLAAVLFLKRITDKTTVQAAQVLLSDNQNEAPAKQDSDLLFAKDIPKDAVIYEINGPFFYSIADQLDEALESLDVKPKTFILRMRHVPVVDLTGVRALQLFAQKCHKLQIAFLITGLKPDILKLFQRMGLESIIGPQNFFFSTSAAVASIKQ